MESGQLELPLDRGIKSLPGLMLQSAILDCTSVEDGKLIDGVAPAWFAIAGWVEKDPRFIYEIPWRKLEELIAGAYLRDGWTEVTLTPRSRDHGRDVIAIKRGICTIRIIDQVKAYAAGRLVTADEVRALLGVLSSDLNVSKGFVTTTARFAPGIKNDPTICPFIPYRLELRDGTRFTNWLLSVARHRRGGSGDAPKDT
jgi:restriction system protein